MLKDSGVLAICIDERELFNLGKMLDEIFGEENRIAIINWQKTYSPKSQSKHVSTATEYVLVYARNLEQATTSKLKHQHQALKGYRNPDADPKGEWRDMPLHAPSGRSRKNIYALQNPFTGGLFYPPRARGWGIKKAEIKSLLEEWGSKYEERDLNDGFSKALVLKGGYQDKKGKGTPRRKRYLKEIPGQTSTTFWRENFNWGYEISGHSQAVKEERFIGVKPLKLFTKIIQLWCPPNGLVLDPFAGSGTTGHAVLQLNKENNTNRSFILIEQGNPKNGDTFAKTLLYPRLKATITEMEREELIEAILSTQLDTIPLSAADQLTEKYLDYRKNSLKIKGQTIPFLKLLSSVTGSGKTAILAQTVSNLLTYYPEIQPLIFWLSCNKVVVQQTYHNLKEKYKSLVPLAQVKSFLGISPSDITQLDTPLIYVDTIQKFSVQNKETHLIVIYDEAHNLTDSQVEKILELRPQALILASGTPSLPSKLTDYQSELKDNGFKPLYVVPFTEVKEKKMVKGKVVLGGYKSQMEEVLNEMLDKDWMELKKAAEKEGLPTPKIIYVCKTNLLELSSTKTKGSKRDNPQVPFELRNAPPILIWRHLVKRKGVDPSTIAIYADVAVAKEEKYALDIEFTLNLFNKGKSSPSENTYEKFIQGNYQHIIFNKSLAEDKTIGSEVAVEQIIGRVLRQPFCRYYASEELNKAYFHIRVDENKVFEKIINELNEKLKLGGDIEIKPPKGGISYLKDLPPKPDKIGKK
ncbi:10912_t:CDS:2, partial [Racocetra persica]